MFQSLSGLNYPRGTIMFIRGYAPTARIATPVPSSENGTPPRNNFTFAISNSVAKRYFTCRGKFVANFNSLNGARAVRPETAMDPS